MIAEEAVRAVVSRWWISYDEAEWSGVLATMHPDIVLVSRSDSGRAANERAIASRVHGLAELQDWWRSHRLDGSFPIRHHLTNLYLTDRTGSSASFVGNTLHSKVDEQCGAHPLVSAVIGGEVVLSGGTLVLRRLETVLDKTPSQRLGEIAHSDRARFLGGVDVGSERRTGT